MSRQRLSIRTLRKLYTDAQALLQARQYEAAIDVFRRVASGIRDSQGMEAAGCCVRLKGSLKGAQSVQAVPQPPDGGSRWAASKAGSGMAGVSSKS